MTDLNGVKQEQAVTQPSVTHAGSSPGATTQPGLASQEAAARLRAEGPNELPSAKPRSLLAIAFGVVKEPMFLMLVACGGIYLVLGDLEEALMLLGFVFIVMGITLYQERKTERALEALRDISSPRALVIRDGKALRIPGRDVVRGDLIQVSEGDRVPADAVLVSGVSVSADESLLTGESVPVRKNPWAQNALPTTADRPGGDDTPFIFSGTMVVQGQGLAVVLGTGLNTEIGKIGKALHSVVEEETLLQKGLAVLVRNLAIAGVSLCVLVVVLYGLTRSDWLNGILAGITLAMAVLPEELPVILTIFLAMGAWRISQKRVLTRRVPAIETLGSATVLCTDKTGTLTLNQMTVTRLYAEGSTCEIRGSETTLPEEFHAVVEYGVLASQVNPYDPMEQAITKLAHSRLTGTEHIHTQWALVQEYPLSRAMLSISRVWQSNASRDLIVAAKGAPEMIADLCHLPKAQLDELSKQIASMAADSLRVLGVARAKIKPGPLPAGQHDFDFEFIGLIGLADPVRPTVPAAVKECQTAGIRVIMITGDYPGTARNIAQQIGLALPENCITGPELDTMSDEELRRRIATANVFARVVPEQKLRLVDALKANGEIVAMTGDGVNDAPALKSAHIGIAMGGRGTDVARESSALVLLDDDFASIVQSVRLGRRIFDNIKKAIAYTFAIHVPIAGMSLLPVLFKWPLALLPVHILFLELIIDPACSTIFEAEKEEANVMNRPPRNPGEPLFSRRNMLLSIGQGSVVLAVVLAMYACAHQSGWGEGRARALSFTTLIVANLALILTNRSWSRTIVQTLRAPNTALWLVLCGATTFLSLVLCVPYLRQLFRFEALSMLEVAACVGAGVLSISWFEARKLLRRSKAASRV